MKTTNRITIREARRLTGLGARAFPCWIRKGRCPLLKVPFKAEQGPNRQWFLDRRQIERLAEIIANLPLAVDGRVEDGAGIWLTTGAIARHYPLPATTINNWGMYWPPLRRKVNMRMQFFKLRNGRFAKFRVYIEADVAEAVAARLNGKDAPAGYMTCEDAATETRNSIGAIYKQIDAGRCPILDRPWDVKKCYTPMLNDGQTWRTARWSDRSFVSISDVKEVRRKKANTPDGWLTPREMSDRTGFHVGTIYSWCEKGVCPTLRRPFLAKKFSKPRSNNRDYERWLIHPDHVEELQTLKRTAGRVGGMINGWPTFAKASAISGYHIDSFRRWYRAGFCNPLRKELRIKEGIAVGANDLFYELPCVHPHDVEDLRRVKAGKEPALRGSSPTKATEPPAPEEASEPQRNGCTAPDVAPPTIADVPPEQFKEAPAPPENGRGGRPTKRERDKYIRRLAKSAGLTRDPAELSRRLNADSAFVERWGTVTKGTVKGVFRRWNGRAQNH